MAPSRACPERDCRCHCGSLVARIVGDGVELRCRRCKRTLLVPWSAREGFVTPNDGDAGVPAVVRGTSVGSAA